MIDRTLPPPPQFSDGRSATLVREALQALHRADPRGFAAVFSNPDGSQVRPKWQHLTTYLDRLASAGLVQVAKGGNRIRSNYLIAPWAKAFYLCDFPDFQAPLEVFSPHLETFAFLTLLQVRPGDTVLDLGTGNGILLIEAARRGATGLGIDQSQRAISFAEANALLNGLEQRVRFALGDMTVPPRGQEWGKPTVVLCNPPFEPVPDDPGFPHRPLHSHGGPYGTEVINKTFSALAAWGHRPALIQFVLFSLGDAGAGPCEGEHLLVTGPLAAAGDSLGAQVELRELSRSIPIEDYLVLNFERDNCEHGEGWLTRMHAEGYRNLHLVFATLYPSAPAARSDGSTLRWIPREDAALDDECFIWPLSSPKRGMQSRGDFGEATLAARYLTDLISAREAQLAGKTIDLSLDEKRIREYVHTLVRSEALFDSNLPLFLLDVRHASGGTPSLLGVLQVTDQDAVFEQLSPQQLEYRARQLLGASVGLTICTAVKDDPLERDRTPSRSDFLSCSIHAGDLQTLLRTVLEMPEKAVQRFAVLSQQEACLSPARQRFFANFLSELAGLAEAVNVRREFEAYSVAHALKHKLGALKSSAREFEKALSGDDKLDPRNKVRSQLAKHQKLITEVQGFAELSHLLHSAVTEGADQTLSALSESDYKFATTKPVDLTDLITAVATDCVAHGALRNRRVVIDPPLSFKAEIRPFFRSATGEDVCLKHDLYREILHEMFFNAMAHAKGDSTGSARVALSVDAVDHRPALVLSDEVEADLLRSRMQDCPENWTEWRLRSSTGLTFVANALRATAAGCLYYRCRFLGAGAARFDVALRLNGLLESQAPAHGDFADGQDAHPARR